MTIDPERVTYFGETDSRNKRVKFGIKSKDRLKHVYVIGKTGMGKSTLLENMAIQDIQNGEGLAFVDPHGKSADLLLKYVPEERVKDVVYFAPFDTEFPVSFNVMEDVGPSKRHLVVSGLMSAFEKIWVDAWSSRMAYILQNTLSALLEFPDATMLGINRMLSDKTFRNKVVDHITDPTVKSFWVDEFANYTERFAAEATPAIQNKVGQFVNNAMIRNIIGQPESSFDIRKVMDERKILIVNLSKGLVGETNAKLLGGMIITKIYLAAMSRADSNEAELNKLPNFYLYVDEFQSFANKSFADILSEARKYKLNLTIAHQYIEQMEEEVRDAVFGNVGTMITFRVGAFDAEVLEKEFAPTFSAQDLVNLGAFQMYLKLMIDSVTSQPFSASSLNHVIERVEPSLYDKIMDSSRKQFAKPRAEVEKAIQEWHDEGKTAPPSRSSSASSPRRETERRSSPVPPIGQGRAGRTSTTRPERYERRDEPKPIDIRGKKEDTKYKKPEPPPMPVEEEFKPLKTISLDDLKKKENNQRKPDEKHVADLRNALKAVVGEVKTMPKNTPPTSPPPEKKGPNPDELKKILNGE